MHPDLVRHWKTVSALLDEALALDPGAREAWLATLGAQHEALKPHLLRLLANEPAESDAFLDEAMPRYDPARLAGAEPAHKAGDRVGEYRLVRELGRGGMGAVWLAERAQRGATMPVALKLPHVEGTTSAIRERFQRERDILAALNHAHIARLLEAGVAEDGQPYLAIEYVEGESLLAHCNARALPIRERVRLFLQVLEAVAYAHANLVIHRDLKPGNILVTSTGEVKLLDFGIAKLIDRATSGAASTELTQRAGHVMTPDYASPEQVAGLPLTTASDVYSLGVLLFELLTGTRPYRLKRGTRAELEEAILSANTALPSTVASEELAKRAAIPLARWRRLLRGDLDTIVLAAMKKLPAERYPGVEAFRQDLERYLDGRPVLARPESTRYRFAKFVLRHKVAMGAAAAVFATVIAGLTVALWQASIARDEANKARAVQGFLTQLFEKNSRFQADAARARTQTIREALVEASDRVPGAFRDSPALQAELSRTVAALLLDVDEIERAAKLFREAIALERANGRTGSDLHVESLLGLTTASRLLGNAAEALAARDEAIALLDARGDRTSLLRARAGANSVSYLARDVQREIVLGTQALALFETRYPDHPERFAATVALAQIYRAQGQWQPAEKYFREAIAIFPRVGSKDYYNFAAARAWAAFCAFNVGRIAESMRDYEAGIALLAESAGANALATRFHRGLYASVLHGAGRREEAHRIWDDLERTRINGVAGYIDFDSAVYRADAYMDEGAPRRAIAQLEPFAGQLVEFGKRFLPNGVRWATLLAKANAMLGRDAAAQAALARIEELPGQYATPARQMNEYKDDVAWMLAASGKVDEARAALVYGADPIGREADAFDGGFAGLNVRASQIALRAGDAAAALRHADRALAHLSAYGQPELMPYVRAHALKAQGDALLASGDPARALESLELAAGIHRRLGDPASLWLADALVSLAIAHQRLGHPREAAASLGLARGIYRQFPSLSPAFTARLRDPG